MWEKVISKIQEIEYYKEESGLPYVLKNKNPPNFPQIRHIENFWSILKQKVYAGNWSAKSWEVLIRQIKKILREIDQNVIVKMFENLGDKINSAANCGLRYTL